MNYKYSEQMSKLDSCPPTSVFLGNIEGYRLVHSIPASAEDFLPVALMQPKRDFSGKARCMSYGLSLFGTEQQAKDHLARLKKNNPKIEKALGNKVQRVAIKKTHGKITKKNRTGHFTLFESTGVELEKQTPTAAAASA